MSGRELVDRMLRQYAAFESLVLDCSRCGRQVPLNYLHPYAHGGFVCKPCLVRMPSEEWRSLIPVLPHREDAG